MKILGILDKSICILLVGARIVIQPQLSEGDLSDLIEYEDLPIFNSWDEVETAAYNNAYLD